MSGAPEYTPRFCIAYTSQVAGAVTRDESHFQQQESRIGRMFVCYCVMSLFKSVHGVFLLSELDCTSSPDLFSIPNEQKWDRDE